MKGQFELNQHLDQKEQIIKQAKKINLERNLKMQMDVKQENY